MLRMLLEAALIAVIAFVVAVVALSAWRSFHQPQQEQTQHNASAKEPKKEQDNAATAPERAEDAIAPYNLWLMIFTGVLAVVALVQIGFLISADRTSERAANAAIESNKISRATYIANDRPWLKIIDARISAPLTFDQNGGDGRVTLRLTITNVGRSPAVSIFIEAKAVASITMIPNFSPDARKMNICQGLRKQHPEGDFGFTLFPGDTLNSGLGITIARAEIDQWNSLLREKGTLQFIDQIAPIIIGCIDYQIPADMSHHQTGFAYHLGMRNPANPNVDTMIKINVPSTPAEKLNLRNWFTGGSYAD